MRILFNWSRVSSTPSFVGFIAPYPIAAAIVASLSTSRLVALFDLSYEDLKWLAAA
jgi:hypothetical protein